MKSSSLIIANWKANPLTSDGARSLAKTVEAGIGAIQGVKVVLAPPFPFLQTVGEATAYVSLGAQDAWWADGPYTGEVSVRQLKELGVEYVIVGHSERRFFLGESEEVIKEKLRGVLRAGLTAILCVGERTHEEGNVSPELLRQLQAAVGNLRREDIKRLVVAHEPVWAISTQPNARPDTPDNAFRALLAIRKALVGLWGRAAGEGVRIIYGGSVNSTNVRGFLTDGKMEGALVGGASLRAEEFLKVIRMSQKKQNRS